MKTNKIAGKVKIKSNKKGCRLESNSVKCDDRKIENICGDSLQALVDTYSDLFKSVEAIQSRLGIIEERLFPPCPEHKECTCDKDNKNLTSKFRCTDKCSAKTPEVDIPSLEPNEVMPKNDDLDESNGVVRTFVIVPASCSYIDLEDFVLF